jgi:hypothetical protein
MASYQICIQGYLDERWLRYFEGLVITQRQDGETVISGDMDLAALHGILNRIRDLNLELISVQLFRSNNDPNIEGNSQ